MNTTNMASTARSGMNFRQFTLGFMFAASAWASEPRTESLLGDLAPVARAINEARGFPLDYSHRGNWSVGEWRNRARAEVQRVLAYSPAPVPLDLVVHSVTKRKGYEIRTVSFAGSPFYRIPAFLLVPEGNGPFPAVVALHDHGGFYTHGKEKLVALENEHQAVTRFRQGAYGGRPYAEELARRGFVVIVADAFYWGERRLHYEQPPADLQQQLKGLDPAAPEYIAALNRYLTERTRDLQTQLGFTGTLWGGIIVHDDCRAVDVLCSLRFVDPARIGCVGLSGGGFRSTYLAGMEPRIKAAVIVGWMTSLPTTLDIPHRVHADMFDPVGVHAYLDHPDIASLAAPDCAIFVQNCAQDRLFTRAGMDLAARKIEAVYADLRQPERFRRQYYDVPHQFNPAMQEDALAWLERWLK